MRSYIKHFLSIVVCILIHLSINGQSKDSSSAANIVIGKQYLKGQNTKAKNLNISVKNDLQNGIDGIEIFYDNSRIVSIDKMKAGEEKTFSIPKKKLRGNNIIVLKYENLIDTLKNTDEIKYNIHMLEIARDRAHIVQFDANALSISKNGILELLYIDTLFSNLKSENCKIVLSGNSSWEEIMGDEFIGLKRCKVVIDSLVKRYKFPRDIFFIKDEVRPHNSVWIGVHYQIMSQNSGDSQLKPDQEDDFFQENQRKNRKKN